LAQSSPAVRDEKVAVRLSRSEWDLVIEHAYLDSKVQEEIRAAQVDGGLATMSLTAEDLDDLIGWMAAAANHAGQRQLMQSLSQVCDKLDRFLDQHRNKVVVVESQRVSEPTPAYTKKQGQYLAFIYYYAKIHGVAPAEADLQRYFKVSAPSVHQMIVGLEARGLIERKAGRARSIRLLVPRAELPDLE